MFGTSCVSSLRKHILLLTTLHTQPMQSEMMTTLQSGKCNHVCIVNLGLFRSGTTTLAEASKKLDLRPHRSYYDVPEEKLKEILCNPKAAVQQWMQKDGRQYLIDHVKIYDLICDGFVSLLPLLSDDSLRMLKTRAEEAGVRLVFVATKRDIDSTILSELHHWIKHDLERKSKLDVTERDDLERLLRERAELHEKRINELASQGRLTVLPIETVEEAWPLLLSNVSSFSEQNWLEALKATGQQNKNPSLPIEGILLTLRIGSSEKVAQKISALKSLLQGLERDRLCRYLVVLGIDADEYESPAAEMVENMLQRHEMESEQMHLFRIIRNPPRLHKHFPICEIWDTLACEAWAEKADWVMLLGDDVEIQCSFHYRAFYRAFLDISEKLDVDFGFGCPWWNDKSFPNFPSFPCIGKKHYDIFGGLIPEHRRGTFINQDLDPYIVQLYLKFGAAPCIKEAALINHVGGNIGAGRARYERVPATRWRDFFLKDLGPLRTFVPRTVTEVLFLDVIVPSYRVRLNYLRSIASLCVPKHVHANFIFIVDNPSELLRQAQEIQTKNRNAEMATTANAESILEHYLSCDGNNVRVRCNKVNVGASASRNRGLEESAAEFVLHLDDDLVPKPDLLEKYCSKLFEIDHSVVGLVGIVRFPRSSTLPMKHAAVLMSYLTFMFEIADKDMYESPAWGVTANSPHTCQIRFGVCQDRWR